MITDRVNSRPAESRVSCCLIKESAAKCSMLRLRPRRNDLNAVYRIPVLGTQEQAARGWLFPRGGRLAKNSDIHGPHRHLRGFASPRPGIRTRESVDDITRLFLVMSRPYCFRVSDPRGFTPQEGDSVFSASADSSVASVVSSLSRVSSLAVVSTGAVISIRSARLSGS